MAPDAVVICGYYSPDACALLSSARRLGARAILMSESTRGDHRRNPLKELFKAWRLRGFHSALCGGIPHRDYLIGLGMPAGKIFTGYNAVDNDFFERESRVAVEKELIPDCLRQLAPGRFFLASNRFVPRKNLGALIGAYADYARRVNEPWGMVLLGDGPERSFLESLVHKHKLTDKVFFSGFRQIDELPAFYAHAGVFVHVPLSEPWGLVVNEAMACGLPVIVSSTAGCARDLCRHGINGLQVDPRSAEQIARALEAVSTHSSVRESFARESRSIIRDYSPGQFAQGLWKAVTVA
nr:glycosyltransferase family 4 protein [Oscillatoria laete-virens]